MKHLHKLMALIAALVWWSGGVAADVVENYVCDFNTKIETSDHAFKVASGWGHLVDSYYNEDEWETLYASYSYSSTSGVDGSGALYAGSQKVGYPSTELYDLIVTPKLTGTSSIKVKRSSSYSTPTLKFYKVTKTGSTYTRGDEITMDLPELSTSEYTTVSIPSVEGEYVGIKASYVYLDDFSAQQAEYDLTKSMKVGSVSNATGSTYPDCDATNHFTVTLKATITNNGDVALNPGDDGFSLSLLYVSSGDTTVLATQAIEEAMGKGASATVMLTASVPYEGHEKYSKYIVRENLGGSVGTTGVWLQPTAYLPQMDVRYDSSKLTATDEINYGNVQGKTSKEFTIRNSGAAPLTVTAITLPDGFECSAKAPLTVEAHKDSVVTISLLGDRAASFSGTATFSGDNVADVTFGLKGVVLDPAKFYVDFEDNQLPAGSYAEDSWSVAQCNTGSVINKYVLSNKYQNRDDKFVTPKLLFEEGDSLTFDAGRANYTQGGEGVYLNVYYSTDRRNWTLYRKIEGSELPSTRLVSYSYYFSTPLNYTIKGLPAGEYYFAFGAGYTYVDNIYGCKRVDVAHDLSVSDQTLPASAMVNHEYAASVTVKNINAKAEEASSYKAELYVGGEKVAEENGADVIEAGGQTTLSLAYVPHTVGIQKAYIVVRSLLDDYTVTSDTAEVNVAKEVGEAELVVGDGKGTATTNVPYYFYNADNAQGAQADIIYTPDMLKAYGLKAGQKISSVAYNGTVTTSKEYKYLNLTVFVGTADTTAYVANTDTAELQRVALYENAPYSFTSGDPFDTQVRLEEPIVWDGEKAIRVFTYAQSSSYTKVQYATDNTYKTAYYKKGNATSFSTSSTPVITLGVAYDPFVLSGKITAAGEPVANAKVKATDGDVYYSAETAEDGTYSLTVYQTDRKYKFTVTAEGYEDYAAEDSIALAGNVEKDVALVKTFHAVKGVVVYKSAPVASAKVTLTNAASETVEATTDEEGVYTFDNVYHGKKYQLAVAAEGYTGYVADDSVEVADADVEIDTIALTKPFVEVSGTVKCGDVPVAGALYKLLSNAAGAVEIGGTTGEDGKFLVAAEQDQKYMLTVTADGYEPFMLEDSVVFTANHDFGDIQLKALSVTISVPDGKILAFSSEKALDFSALDSFKAYVVTGVEKKNDAAFTKLAQVTTVPASTGVIIVAAPGDYQAPVAKDAPAVENNLLVATASASYTIKFDDANEVWALGLLDNNKPAFTTTIGTEIPQGSAYLRKTSDVEYIYLYEADVPEPDAIRSVEGGMLDLNADMFNTSGQKVDKSYRGIVIQNGKKFSRK